VFGIVEWLMAVGACAKLAPPVTADRDVPIGNTRRQLSPSRFSAPPGPTKLASDCMGDVTMRVLVKERTW